MENLPLILFSVLITILVLCLTYLAGKLARLRPSRPKPSKPEPPRNPDEGEKFDMKIEIGEDNKWKITNPKGVVGPIYVRRGDRIVWNIAGTDAFFQFPKADHFHVDDRAKGGKRTDGWVYEIGPDGGQLSFIVSANACPGAYTYSVFCNVSKKSNIPVTGYAEGGSPPEFIIMI